MTLSDHIPVVCTFALTKPQQSGVRKSSYYKMDVSIIDSQDMLSRIEEVWQAQLVVNRDARVIWDLARADIRRFLQSEQKKRNEQRKLRQPGEELQRMRILVGENSTTENTDKLREVEDEIRAIEHQDAIKARWNSRVRWLQLGDAPSKYFFNQLKAKHARESIHSLRLPLGQTTENEEQILQEIYRFYAELYTRDPATKCFDREREVTPWGWSP